MPSRATTGCWAGDVRFLTGMDEHSAKSSAGAAARHRAERPGRRVGGDAGARRSIGSSISYDRFIRTTDPDHARASTEMVRRAHGGRRHLQGHLRRLVLPGRQRVQDRCADRRRPLPRSPDPGAAVAGGGELLLRPVALPGEAGAAVRARTRRFCEPEHFRNEVLGWLQRGAARLLDQPRRRVVGDPVPRRPGASHLRLVRRADQLRDRRRLPG